jgi:glutamyl-Q tRNA(Asp) synthetase
MAATRFAPSPTGPLHLGHAYSAVMAQQVAQRAGGAFRLRIDDIDQGRSRDEWRAAINADLQWLGLVVDGPVIVQSARRHLYATALVSLRQHGLVYPCFCTRAAIAGEIAASANAPHGPDGPPYPGTCRHLEPDAVTVRLARGDAAAWRMDMAAAADRTGPLVWDDQERGSLTVDPLLAGDVVLWRRDDWPAYHLASTIDDADMAITHVVRGRDLMAATHVHRILQAVLNLPVPLYHHHDLVAGADGRRLAKRDDAASLSSLRDKGVDGLALAESLRAGILPAPYGWAD